MRGATIDYSRHNIDGVISIHAPRERSDNEKYKVLDDEIISIHAPRERSDPQLITVIHNPEISIHAPRERSDQ